MGQVKQRMFEEKQNSNLGDFLNGNILTFDGLNFYNREF